MASVISPTKPAPSYPNRRPSIAPSKASPDPVDTVELSRPPGAPEPDRLTRDIIAGADSNALFHATHSEALEGIIEAGGLVPSSDLEELGIERVSGEGSSSTPNGGKRPFISFGAGQEGLGSSLKYAETLLDPPASYARLSPEELSTRIQDYRTMLDHEDMGKLAESELPGVDNVIGGRLEEMELEMERRQALPRQNEPFPILFGVRGNDLEKTPSSDVPGEVRVDSRVPFNSTLESAFAPEDRLPELRARLEELLGPDHGVEVLPLETLKNLKAEFPEMEYAHRRTPGAVDRFDGFIKEAREELLPEKHPVAPAPAEPEGLGRKFLKRIGFLGGVAATTLTATTTSGTAGEVALAAGETAVETMVPGGYSGLRAAEGRWGEAVLGAIEEVPFLGLGATELARPLLRRFGAEVEPSLGEISFKNTEEDRLRRQAESAELASWVREVGGAPDRPITSVDVVRIGENIPEAERPAVHFMVDSTGRLVPMVDPEQPIQRTNSEILNETKMVVGVVRPATGAAPALPPQAEMVKDLVDGLAREHLLSGVDIEWHGFGYEEQEAFY